MKLDALVMLPDLHAMPDTAKAAEACGFDTIWTVETSHEPFLPLVLAAEHTERIELGTAIALAFPRSPMAMAYLAWDLAQYSKGRFIYGLGTQVRAHNEKRFSVAFDKPGPRFRDVILAMRAIWDSWQNGTKLRYEGDFFRHTLMTPFFNPGPIDYPNIPIYVAGANPYICRMAGELADGFHVHPLSSVKYIKETVIPNMAKGAAKAGRSVDDIEMVQFVFTAVGDTEEDQVNAMYPIRQQLAFYGSTPAYFPMLECHGWDIGPKLNEMSKQGQWAEMSELVTDEMMDVFCVRGTPETIADKVVERYHGVIDRVTFSYPYLPGAEDDKWRRYIETLHAAG